MKRLLLLLVLIAPLTITAKTVSVFYWTIPSTYDDNVTHFDISKLLYSTVLCGNQSGSYSIEAVVLAPATSMPIDHLVSADGSYYCTLTITSIEGDESPPSPEVFFSLAAGQPTVLGLAAPGFFRVE